MSGFLFSLFLIALHTIGVGETHVPFNQLEITCLFLFLALSCLLFSLIDRKYTNEKVHSDFTGSIWLGLLFAWGAIGFFYSVRPDMSFEFIAKYLTGIALLLFLHRTLRTLEQVRRLFWLLASIAASQGIMSWALQFYFPTVNTTIDFVFLNSNFWAGYLLFPLAMSAILFLAESEKKRKGIAWLLFALIWAQLGFTSSRGAHVAAAVMMLFLILALLKNGNKKNAGLLVLGFGVGRLLFQLIILLFNDGQANPTLGDSPLSNSPSWEPPSGEILAATTSYFKRTLFWEAALRIFEQYPLTGSGPWSFSALFYYVVPYPQSIANPAHVHNLYLQTLSDMGLIGLGLLLTTFFFFLKNLFSFFWKNQGRESLFALGLLVAIAGYLTHNLVETMWPSPYFLFTLVICFGSSQALIATGESSERKAGPQRTSTILAFGILLIGAGVLWMTFNYSQKLNAFQSIETGIEEKILLTEEASTLCPLCDFPVLYRAFIFTTIYEKTHDPLIRNKAERALKKLRRQAIPLPEALFMRGILFEADKDYVQAIRYYMGYHPGGTNPHRLKDTFARVRMKKKLEASSQQ